jgi:hypothetical protein
MDALIVHYLHAEPSDDLEAYLRQAARAIYLERRYFENLGRLMGAGT